MLLRKMFYLKLIITAFLIGLVSFIGTISFTPANDEYGTVTIEIVNKDGFLITDRISFEEDSDLFNILRYNYEIEYIEYSIGVVLLCIESICTDFNNSYIAIYINGDYSNYGLSIIPLKDGSIYSFIYTELN